MIRLFRRVWHALLAFFGILIFGRLPQEVEAARSRTPVPDAPPAPGPAALPEPDRAVQLLALLQRDGRLVDFLMEDVGAYPDAQIGAAVRDVHTGCRHALERYLSLDPVIDAMENEPVTIEDGIDPSAVKLVGHAGGRPPYRGLLRHRGWRARRVELPPLPGAADHAIVAPAEVELGQSP